MVEKYPNLLRRYFASLIDFLVALTIAAVVGKTLVSNANLTPNLNVWVLFLTFAIYEPLMTTVGCTIGQFIFRFRVRKHDKNKKINIGQAFVRLVIKYSLGLISLLTMPARSDRRAIHDLATGSIVVNSNGSA